MVGACELQSRIHCYPDTRTVSVHTSKSHFRHCTKSDPQITMLVQLSPVPLGSRVDIKAIVTCALILQLLFAITRPSDHLSFNPPCLPQSSVKPSLNCYSSGIPSLIMVSFSPPASFILPDLVTYCTFELSYHADGNEVAQQSVEWLDGNCPDLNERQRRALRGLQAGELTAYCYPTASPDRLRVVSDFIVYLFYLYAWSPLVLMTAQLPLG